MSNAELIYEEIKTMSTGRMAQVLDFVRHIKQEDAEDGDDSWFEKGGPCPVCAKHTDPVTGELRFNAETIAAIEEGRAMMRGEIPAKWYSSAEEMWADLDKDDMDD